jgi:hypothetical protein
MKHQQHNSISHIINGAASGIPRSRAYKVTHGHNDSQIGANAMDSRAPRTASLAPSRNERIRLSASAGRAKAVAPRSLETRSSALLIPVIIDHYQTDDGRRTATTTGVGLDSDLGRKRRLHYEIAGARWLFWPPQRSCWDLAALVAVGCLLHVGGAG